MGTVSTLINDHLGTPCAVDSREVLERCRKEVTQTHKRETNKDIFLYLKLQMLIV